MSVRPSVCPLISWSLYKTLSQIKVFLSNLDLMENIILYLIQIRKSYLEMKEMPRYLNRIMLHSLNDFHYHCLLIYFCQFFLQPKIKPQFVLSLKHNSIILYIHLYLALLYSFFYYVDISHHIRKFLLIFSCSILSPLYFGIKLLLFGMKNILNPQLLVDYRT